MHKSLQILGLILALTAAHAKAEGITEDGSARYSQTQKHTAITITGPAADALYDDLAQRKDAVILPCGRDMSVRLDAFLCIRDSDNLTKCMTNLLPDRSKFSLPGSCDGPSPSVIGVGNPPAGKGKEMKTEFDESGLE